MIVGTCLSFKKWQKGQAIAVSGFLVHSSYQVEALFVSLDTSRTGSVSREDLRVLSVEKRKSDMTTACKAVTCLKFVGSWKN